MKLLELLVQETKKGNFNWPEGCNYVAQDSDESAFTGNIYAYKDKPVKSGTYWCSNDGSGFGERVIKGAEVADDCMTSLITRKQYEAALAAEHPQWDGEGLPPVGCECEMQDALGCWQFVTVFAHHAGFAHGWDNVLPERSYFSNNSAEFRPIRSERDKAIQQMRKVVTNYNKTDVIHAIEQLYDAGYRKLSD